MCLRLETSAPLLDGNVSCCVPGDAVGAAFGIGAHSMRWGAGVGWGRGGCDGGSTKQTSRSRAALAAALKPVWKQLPQSNDELTSASATFPVEAPQPLG